MDNYLELVYAQLAEPDYAADNLRGMLQHQDQVTQSHLATEIKCFELRLDEGDLEPVFSAGDFKQTDISQLTAPEIAYIEDRLSVEKDKFLIARYAHILFRKTRDNRYALQAIPAYHDLASEYFNLLPSKAKNIIEFMDMVEAYAHLSLTIKYQADECRAQLISWNEQHDQKAFYYECFLKLFTKSKLFKPAHLSGFTEKALSYVHQLNCGFEAEDYLETCLALAKKEQADQQPIYTLMAENQLKLADKRPDDTGLIRADCYLKASEYYKKAKNQEKANETLRLLQAHKKDIKLGYVTVRTDITKTNDAIVNIASHMLASQPRTVFNALAIDQRLLPDISKFKPDKDAAFLNSVRVSAFDINGNTQILSDFEKKRRDIFMEVQFRIELFIPFLIKELVNQMKKANRDFVAEGLDYFNHTWFQNELAKTALSDTQFTYRWMTSLRPALEILLKVNITEKEKLLTPEEQMAFDQLAVKFEGLLRDLCGMAGLTTIKVREDQTVNKDVNELLQSPELQTKFKKDDLDFWLYTFTACGYNIRNNVAHAFYHDHNYTVALSNILLVAYVRLAKYNDIVRQAMKIGEIQK